MATTYNSPATASASESAQPTANQLQMPPHSSFKSMNLVIGGLLVFVAAVGGIFLGRTYFVSDQPTPNPLPIPTSAFSQSPTFTPDPTVDWKTYVNSRQNYQISYPAEFSITEDTSETTESTESINGKKIKQDIITISKNDNLPRIKIDVVSKQDSSREESMIRRLELSDIKIGNQTTYTDSRVYIPENMGPAVTYYYVLYNDKVYTITTFIDYKANDSINIERLFTQIFSTFKFIDQLEADGGCKVGGCNGEVCQDSSAEPLSTACVFRPEYSCFALSECEKQNNEKCGWTQTEELKSCLSKFNN